MKGLSLWLCSWFEIPQKAIKGHILLSRLSTAIGGAALNESCLFPINEGVLIF